MRSRRRHKRTSSATSRAGDGIDKERGPALDDLADLFAEVRAWAKVIEKKPAVFYVRGQPFLHFHLDERGRRQADVKGRRGWVRHDLPRPLQAAQRRACFRELRLRYAEK